MVNRQDAKMKQTLTDQMDISGLEAAVCHGSLLVTDLDDSDQLP